ncbi:MAG: DUF3592 domain-containing protein [Luteolibacter sp.]
MKRILTLSLFPILGLLLFAAALLWSERELRLRFLGLPVKGKIIGIVLQRPNHAAILTALDSHLELGLANGDRVVVESRDLKGVSAVYNLASGGDGSFLSLADLSLDNTSSKSRLSLELRRVIDDSISGNAEIIGWTLQRESRRSSDPLRVVRIEKIESAHGYFEIESVPLVMGLKNGKVNFEGIPTNTPQAGEIRIRADFDYSNPAAVMAKKGNSMVDYEYTINGQKHTPDKKDYFLAAEPYSTVFIPIFGFEANRISVARLSHIGRHGGPTLALRLFGDCTVYYDPKNPTEAVLMADPGSVAGDPLRWFSRYCEGLLSQWGTGALIALAGCVFFVTGMILISLEIRPSKAVATLH